MDELQKNMGQLLDILEKPELTALSVKIRPTLGKVFMGILKLYNQVDEVNLQGLDNKNKAIGNLMGAIADIEFTKTLPTLSSDIKSVLIELNRVYSQNSQLALELGKYRDNGCIQGLSQLRTPIEEYILPSPSELAAACRVPEHLLWGTEPLQTDTALVAEKT